MGLTDFFKIFKLNKAFKQSIRTGAYLPFAWEDEYCQIEIVPLENKAFLVREMERISQLVSAQATETGFSAVIERRQLPELTATREIRADYLERLLVDAGFEKAKSINYQDLGPRDCENGVSGCYGFPGFSVFFEGDGEVIENIWLNVGHTINIMERRAIVPALSQLGAVCELILVDWNSHEIIDLADNSQLRQYLETYWD